LWARLSSPLFTSIEIPMNEIPMKIRNPEKEAQILVVVKAPNTVARLHDIAQSWGWRHAVHEYVQDRRQARHLRRYLKNKF
jgi:hypothetical protein